MFGAVSGRMLAHGASGPSNLDSARVSVSGGPMGVRSGQIRNNVVAHALAGRQAGWHRGKFHVLSRFGQALRTLSLGVLQIRIQLVCVCRVGL